MSEEELFERIKKREPIVQPVTREELEDAEARMGFRLPALLGRLYTEIGNGGFGPNSGLFGLNVGACSKHSMSIPNVYLQAIADESEDWPEKLVLICEWGCGYYSALDCSAPEGELVNVLGELELQRTGCTFAQWMEDW